VEAVTSWLADAGIEDIYNNNKSIHFVTTVDKVWNIIYQIIKDLTWEQASTLLKTKWQRPQATHLVLFCPRPLESRHRPNFTDHIFRKTRRCSNHSIVQKREDGSRQHHHGGAFFKCISCFLLPNRNWAKLPEQMYSVGGYTPSVESGSWIGFGSFLNNSASYADLAKYEQHYGLPSHNFINDQNPTTGLDFEPDLDVQNIVGVSHTLPVVEYLTGGAQLLR
jgi:tripeptidyl-peptidase-1